jgi:hypothetical protein
MAFAEDNATRRPSSRRSCSHCKQLGWTDGRSVRIDTRWGEVAIWVNGYYHGKRGDVTPDTQWLVANAKSCECPGCVGLNFERGQTAH